ncbi:hypothetical protein C823_005677 [Eubacterium plexicaudatum ASF492]|nr:hypothetical protein C823_005677 [Eubacterium plexicaudatum ASF492]
MFGKNKKEEGIGVQEDSNAAVQDVHEQEVVKTVHMGTGI